MSFSVIVHLAHLHILQSTDFVNRIQIRGIFINFKYNMIM